MSWSKGDIEYAKFLTESAARKPGWLDFAGKVLIAGIELDLHIDVITEYLFESYNGLDLEEVSGTYEEVKKDLLEYFKNK